MLGKTYRNFYIIGFLKMAEKHETQAESFHTIKNSDIRDMQNV